MGKISKKYIGDDQVGSVQIELENALSLRAKTADGLSSVDLLEYSASDALVVQQDLHIADEKNIVSDYDLGQTFYIRTENSAYIALLSNNLASGNTGNVSLLSGDATSGDSGSIYLSTGTASGTRGSVVLNAAYVENNVIGGNSVSMNFSGASASSMAFTDSLLFESGRSLGITFQNAGSVNAFAITGISLADSAVGPVQLIGAKLYKTGGGAATSGAVSLSSSADLGLVFGEDAEISSGDISIVTGNGQVKGTGANASSGDIVIETGSKEGTGTRGSITLDALEVQCSSMQFKDAADPTSAQDLATKAYVDAQIESGTDFHKEIITLDGTDITNQYVDLEFECIPQSIMIGVGQRVNLYEGSDFSVSVDGGTGGVARVSFTGPSADGGAEELVDGDILYISFVKA